METYLNNKVSDKQKINVIREYKKRVSNYTEEHYTENIYTKNDFEIIRQPFYYCSGYD